jgi:hypothetical protein
MRQPRSHKQRGFMTAIAIPAMLFGSLLSAPAQAAFVETLDQVGSNVVASGSGSIDLASLMLGGGGMVTAQITPAFANISSGPATLTPYSSYSGISGPTSFGSGFTSVAASGSGDIVEVVGSASLLDLPSGYVSGALLSNTSAYTSTTLSLLGVTPGTYEWTWGTGATADSFTLEIGTTPLPAALPLFATGLGAMGLFGWRRKRKTAAIAA